jgi:single-strand DNA-binding protein
MTNVVVLIGRLARPPEARELPSGDRLVAYEVTVDRPGERAETVPVVWFAAPASGVDHDVNERMVVVGRVRRRFFRTGGGTQSRTEVVAEAVVNARHTKRVQAALARARAALEEVGA